MPVIDMFGRAPEAAAVLRFAERVASGPVGLVVEGEPGVGKTTVVSEVLRATRERGYRVVQARPAEAEADLSFAALGDLVGGVFDEVSEELPPPQRDALAVALLGCFDDRPCHSVEDVVRATRPSAEVLDSLFEKGSPSMRRALGLLPSLIALAAASLMLAGAVNGASRHTLDQARASGWDCDPPVLIGGHYHCSPPGKQGVQHIIDGTATSASIVHQVFRADGTHAGAETLIRADLFAGQPCPTDQWLPVPPWLPTPTYFACHHFAFTP